VGAYLFLHWVLIGYQFEYMHICLLSLTFSKLGPPPTWHFLKVNTCHHLITDDLKNLSICNWTLPRENNKVGCLSKIWFNNNFIPGLCYLHILKENKSSDSFSCYKYPVCQSFEDLAKTQLWRTLLKIQHVFLRGSSKNFDKRTFLYLSWFLLKNRALYLINHIPSPLPPPHNCPSLGF